jgi:Leucine-rich repeat (LRR) protein
MHNEEGLRAWLLSLGAIGENVKDLATVKRLDLSGKKLETLPDSIGLLTDLIALNLSNNRLTTLPESVASMKWLSNLDIRRNMFTSIPAALAETPLQSLNASSNDLVEVNVLKSFKHLRVLDLSINQIEQLKECFYMDNEIRTLNLSENYLTDIGDCFVSLRNVERLNLSGNMLKSLTRDIESCGSLEVLNLSDNRIETIDDALFRLDIETLDLSSNRLKSLTLKDLSNLEELVLDDNPLRNLDVEKGFAPYLRSLSCDSCGITEFLLLESAHMEQLCYSGNQIEHIPSYISRYTLLSELDLENNNIVELPTELENLTRLQTLYLAGNPLNNAAKHVVEILHPDICDIMMKTGITIEEAMREDLAQMAHLLSELFSIEADFDVDYEKQLSGITKLFELEGTVLLVARHDEKVVGMLTMQRLISSAEGDVIGQIEDLVVEESYRKMGVGSRLINKMRFLAQEYGYKRTQLVADLDNAQAHHFYSRRGFRRTNLAVYHFQTL